jgi:hypothetical protein
MEPLTCGPVPPLVRGEKVTHMRIAMSLLLTSAITMALPAAHAHETEGDRVVFSFATVGDSRQDPASYDPTTALATGAPGAPGQASAPGFPSLTGTLLPQDAQWLQNTKAFARILRDIQSEKPNLLLFNGDMIYGYGRPSLPPQLAAITSVPSLMKTDAVFEYLQYAYWRGIVAPLFETGTYVVPVPGNHETQCNSKDTGNSPSNCASGKKAYIDNEQAYLANMGDLIEDVSVNERFETVSGAAPIPVNGFTSATAPVSGGNNGTYTTANSGGENAQETELSYSFDIVPRGTRTPELLHFVVINTDPAGADATAPSDWLAADLSAAKRRAEITGAKPKYFVFGHKPAFTYDYNLVNSSGINQPVAAGGLDANTAVDPASTLTTDGVTINTGGNYRNAFWAVIAHYNATYFSGHEHIVHVDRFADPTNTSTNKPYQVIVGAGGSPFDDALAPGNAWDRFYGWALVQVHASGAVTLSVQGFDDGANYDPRTGVITSLGRREPLKLLYSVEDLQ